MKDYETYLKIIEFTEYFQRIEDILNVCFKNGIIHCYCEEQIKYLKFQISLLPLVLSDVSNVDKSTMCAENSYMFLCSIQKERTPSFRLYDYTDTYTCYGCGNCDNIIKYLEEKYKISFKEAVQLLLKNFLLKDVNENNPWHDIVLKY